jgi:hypothetical protein
MKKLLPIIFMFLVSNMLHAQSEVVGIIGELTEWSSDIIMTNDMTDLNKYTAEIAVFDSQDGDGSGFIDLKFRQNLDWGTNWGASDFPSGTAVDGGANIPVPAGSYLVEFDRSTGEYSFTEQCNNVSIIGEITEWGSDIFLTRSSTDPNEWTGFIATFDSQDGDASGFIDLKFRQNSDWGTNWGASDFPSGTAVGDGPNVPVPAGSYDVTFNCSTGDYSFTAVPGLVGVVGEFTNWGGDPDVTLKRDGNDWSGIITVNETHDLDENGTVELKFRENSDWGTNWGGSSDCGTATLNGDNVSLAFGSYAVTFNDQTLDYCFTPTCGQVSMIGAFNGWGADVNMVRSESDPNMWTAERVFYADVEMKWRENADWGTNWGATDFPTGTTTLGGGNVPVVAGEYTISFNCSTGAYSFVSSNNLPCGEVGIIGNFNNFGTADPATDPVTDVWMNRDPNNPTQFSLFYNFDAATPMYFREDGQPISNDAIWGGSGFPLGVGVQDVTTQIPVEGGKFNINFNCFTRLYEFERLGNSATAPKVFNMVVDGVTDEADWNIDRGVLSVLEGDVGDDGAQFAVTYNDEFIFVGVNVTDGEVNLLDNASGDNISIYIDGDKSGGDYTDADIAVRAYDDTNGAILNGNTGTAFDDWGVTTTSTGYSAEFSFSWAELGVDPSAIASFGFDVIVQDVDGADTARYAWNGTLDNDTNTSGFGDMNLGGLECGQISMFGDNIGDVGLNTLTATPTEYVATFEFSAAEDIVFRKDNSDVVTWGGGAAPSGTATLGGDVINVAAGRYMVSFDCSTLDYNFADATAGDCVAISDNTSTPATIDGDLAEYTLDQVMDLVVDGADENNTITWGTRWDNDNLYIAAQVTDGTVLSSGSSNPWEQDAIEVYIDGNHDADGEYDTDKDVQLVIHDDGAGATQIWNNGGPAADVEASFALTATGYNVEVKYPFSNIGFVPGAGRTIGFTIGTNDADNAVGARENQIAWCGTGTNYNNTSEFGDLQFTGGMMIANENIYLNNEILVYPNPASSFITIQALSDAFDSNTNVRMYDLLGRTIMNQKVDLSSSNVQLNVENIPAGIFYLELLSSDGKIAIKKLVIE